MKAPGRRWMIFIAFTSFLGVVLYAYFTGEVTLRQIIDWVLNWEIHIHETS